MYTDEQLKRVAEWLGITDGLQYYAEETVYQDRFGNRYRFWVWLLSPEGRCAIEDKFTYHDSIISTKVIYRPDEPKERAIEITICGVFEPKQIPWPDVWYYYGPTPAEAWLSAAVKMTEVL
jgi:hypothetical protein